MVVGEIITGIVQSVQKFIDWVLKTLPKPLLFILFLFLIVIIGNLVMPTIINLSGTFCVDGNRYDGGPTKIVDNVDHWLELVGGYGENTTNGSLAVAETCLIRDPSTNFTYFDGQFCTSCEPTTTLWSVVAYPIVCAGDAYNQNLTGGVLNWYKNLRCTDGTQDGIGRLAVFDQCDVPPNFRWDNATKRFVCLNNAICGNTTTYSRVATTLQLEGYTPYTLPATTGEPEKWGVACDLHTPRLKVAGIDILSLQIWVVLTLLSILLWAVFKFRPL